MTRLAPRVVEDDGGRDHEVRRRVAQNERRARDVRHLLAEDDDRVDEAADAARVGRRLDDIVPSARRCRRTSASGHMPLGCRWGNSSRFGPGSCVAPPTGTVASSVPDSHWLSTRLIRVPALVYSSTMGSTGRPLLFHGYARESTIPVTRTSRRPARGASILKTSTSPAGQIDGRVVEPSGTVTADSEMSCCSPASRHRTGSGSQRLPPTPDGH